MPYATLRRWRARWREGQPLRRRPGPGKTAPLPVAELRSRVAGLGHARKRSRGVGTLHAEYRHAISQRDFAALVAGERHRQQAGRRAALHHVTWNVPNLAWAIDATLLRHAPYEPGMVVVLARDLATHFHFDPLVLPAESAQANEEWLRGLLRHHGAPLLLKRDNGAPFNEEQLDGFLAERCVLPLNSPVCHPQYNGAIEHGVGSFKRTLLPLLDPAIHVPAQERLHPLVRAVVHLHNTRPRRSLGGLSPAQAYYDTRPFRCSRRRRHEIFEWISREASERIQTNRERTGRHDFATAWRQAVVVWLRRQHLITVSQNQKPLPDFIERDRPKTRW